MVGVARRDSANTVGKLPGNKQASLATHLHPLKALIPARNETPKPLREGEGLCIAKDWLSVRVLLRLAILVHHRHAMVEGGVEFPAVGGKPAGVVHLVHLVGLSFRAGSNLDVLVAKGESWLCHGLDHGNAGGQLDADHRGRPARGSKHGGMSDCCARFCTWLGRNPCTRGSSGFGCWRGRSLSHGESAGER